MGGHINIGPITFYGENGHWAVNIRTKRWGYIVLDCLCAVSGVGGLCIFISRPMVPWAQRFAFPRVIENE
jgi:hypothetical protein